MGVLFGIVQSGITETLLWNHYWLNLKGVLPKKGEGNFQEPLCTLICSEERGTKGKFKGQVARSLEAKPSQLTMNLYMKLLFSTK